MKSILLFLLMMRIFGFWVNHEPALNQNMATKGMSIFCSSMYAEHGRVDRKEVTMLDKLGDMTKNHNYFPISCS